MQKHISVEVNQVAGVSLRSAECSASSWILQPSADNDSDSDNVKK